MEKSIIKSLSTNSRQLSSMTDLKERAKDKMARFKELMILHMTSPNDAFRFVILVINNEYSLMKASLES
jgi:hypothetical protein